MITYQDLPEKHFKTQTCSDLCNKKAPPINQGSFSIMFISVTGKLNKTITSDLSFPISDFSLNGMELAPVSCLRRRGC